MGILRSLDEELGDEFGGEVDGGFDELTDPSQRGIIPFSLDEIFSHCSLASSSFDISCSISMSFLQIYKESIQDLLAPHHPSSSSSTSSGNLMIREDPSRGFYVEGLHEYMVRSYQEV